MQKRSSSLRRRYAFRTFSLPLKPLTDRPNNRIRINPPRRINNEHLVPCFLCLGEAIIKYFRVEVLPYFRCGIAAGFQALLQDFQIAAGDDAEVNIFFRKMLAQVRVDHEIFFLFPRFRTEGDELPVELPDINDPALALPVVVLAELLPVNQGVHVDAPEAELLPDELRERALAGAWGAGDDEYCHYVESLKGWKSMPYFSLSLRSSSFTRWSSASQGGVRGCGARDGGGCEEGCFCC